MRDVPLRFTTMRPRRLKVKPAPVVILAGGHQDLSHLDDPMVRPVAGRAGWVEPVPAYLANPKRGVIEAWGEVLVKNGDTEFRARNKIVGQALRHLVNLGCIGVTITSSGNGTYQPFGTNDMTRSYIRVGTGAGSTTDGTTALITPVNTNPSSTLFTFDNPVAGTYRAKFTATWNSGVLTAVTVTEIGIFADIATVLGTVPNCNQNVSTVYTPANTTALALFARLSAADGEFSSFTVNTSVPLTIEYRVVYTFT